MTDDKRRSQMDLPGHEDVIEIPRRMVQFFLEAGDGDGTDA